MATQHHIPLAARVCARDSYDIGTVSGFARHHFVVKNGTTVYHVPYGAVREVTQAYARSSVILSCKLDQTAQYRVEAK